MATLATITDKTRTILKITVAAIIFGTILFFLIKGLLIVKNIVAPPPPPPPENKYGSTLPRVNFPVRTFDKLTYKVNTVSGTLPVAPDRIKIFKIFQSAPDINSLSKARNIIARTEFKFAEKQISENTYSWSDNERREILYDIYTNNFTLTSDYLQNPEIFENLGTRKEESLFTVISFLDTLGVDKSDLNLQKTTYNFYTIGAGRLIETPQNQAQIVQVNLFQNDVDTVPINYPQPNSSSMSFYVGFDINPKIVSGIFTHHVVDTSDSSTYLIKSTQQALDDLKKGNAYMVFNKDVRDSMDITKVDIGYYMGQTNQQYLVPIFIFEGPGFKAYVHALPEATLKN